ncbi:hypothetical protein [Aquabacterium humicola]|uniref:hypothetical protein n=1 Tax=Aquabacterium humicola TaxID=3237377 RepID=UPI002543E9CB|nr:hypothetical protein [Rubrivivax pictus]
MNADQTRLPPLMRLLLLCLLLAAGSAGAQTLPFLEPGGVIRTELRYSALVATLGEPPRSREWVPAGEAKLNGGIVFEYPERGLAFIVTAADRRTRDPRIATMQVRPPAAERTHEGLAIGMRREQAKPLIASVWRERYASDEGLIHTIGIADAGGGAREGRLRFVGDKGLVLMEFDASTRPPPPRKLPRWLSGLIPLPVLLVLVIGLAWLFKRRGLRLPDRRQDDEAPARTPVRDALGLLLAVGGGVLVVGELPGLRTGDGYSRLPSLLGVVMGCGLVILAMWLWARSARRGLRWIGFGAFALFVGAMLLAKLAR